MLKVQEIIGSGQVSKTNRIRALAHDVSKVLQDSRHLQGGGLFPQLQPMTHDQGNGRPFEVEDQEALFGAVTLVHVGCVLGEISERLEVALERRHKPREFHGDTG